MNQAHGIDGFTDLVDLANERIGGAAIWCTDDFFAPMENLVKAAPARFDEALYTDRGKWMDGWESKRSHKENHGGAHEDHCVVRLGVSGIVRGVTIDTAYFRGNFPAAAALEGACVEGYPSGAEIAQHAHWFPLLARSELAGNTANSFAVTSSQRVTHVRLRIFPDGGVARLRVYGTALPDWSLVGGLDGVLDVASCALGGLVVSCSDMFFGSRHNLLFPQQPLGMHDGWETRRARRAGFDWACIALAARASVQRVVIDTAHFKGNCPQSAQLEGTRALKDPLHPDEGTEWTEIVPRTPLQPHTAHTFVVPPSAEVTHVRLRIYPDGGVARLRVFGALSVESQRAQRLRRIAAMTDADARAAFLVTCGARRFADAMVAQRPFVSWAALVAAADKAFDQLSEADWLEAFAAHPRIGGKKPATSAAAGSVALSAQEQQGVHDAHSDILTRLAEHNARYLEKNGFVFLIKATGKTAAEMLAALEQRLQNDRATEVAHAAREQRLITELRLDRMG